MSISSRGHGSLGRSRARRRGVAHEGVGREDLRDVALPSLSGGGLERILLNFILENTLLGGIQLDTGEGIAKSDYL